LLTALRRLFFEFNLPLSVCDSKNLTGLTRRELRSLTLPARLPADLGQGLGHARLPALTQPA
jgi:hypothetical protein